MLSIISEINSFFAINVELIAYICISSEYSKNLSFQSVANQVCQMHSIGSLTLKPHKTLAEGLLCKLLRLSEAAWGHD